MKKKKGVARTKDDLVAELHEQLALLRHSCEVFDGGFHSSGKYISLSLRILLHSTRNSFALLDQLNLRSLRFFDSAGPLNPRNLLTECNMLVVSVRDGEASYEPLVGAGFENSMRRLPFADWWNQPILRDNKRREFTRRELVLSVAETDGGAHVDPELDEAYAELSRGNSLGHYLVINEREGLLQGKPQLVCMRQIAHELLHTLDKFVPELRPHAQPVIPVRVGLIS